MLFPSTEPAILALADGTVFHGYAVGATGNSVGEVVFNTAMTGYQEILSDPSYAGQMVTLTYSHIGNTGTNSLDMESQQVHASGLIVRDASLISSNWRDQDTLDDFLKQSGVVGIAGIDTRELTRKLRSEGSINGCIMSGAIDQADAVAKAQQCVGTDGMDLAIQVSTKEPYKWSQGLYDLNNNVYAEVDDFKYRVVCYDFGVKRNILRILAHLGCDVTVVPADTSVAEAMQYKPDGVFLSNGPGDPAACDYAIAACREFLQNDVPIFGICLGHQIMALASGAATEKMKFGHHGANHPVAADGEHQVMITSQNHNYAVSAEGLPDTIEVTHRSLFDASVQGIRHKHKPAYGFQGHPEASPGPHDARHIFNPFIEMMRQAQENENA
ncbi:glutamine-hydrolyzing carbamoyl-phosphate synthase small subunit [Marinicella sp. W31]|uniref:glutamine-hydrolyzing carbamoyl-phosphate synthase small subunit n=1 Tax=Marinicella sp. W31 TaxID=3023713 RepID=UPI0037580629